MWLGAFLAIFDYMLWLIERIGITENFTRCRIIIILAETVEMKLKLYFKNVF